MVLDFLKSQTHVPEQIIIVDDGSDPELAKQHRALAQKYKTEYYYFQHLPKRMRLHEAFNIGLNHSSQELICFGAVDIIADNDYCERCANLVAQYENMVLSHINYRLPLPHIIKRGLVNGKTLFDMVNIREGRHDIAGFMGECDPDKFIATGQRFELREYFYNPSYYNDPQPIKGWTIHFDGNIWITNKNAMIARWDNNVTGWAYNAPEYGMICLKNGLSLVCIGDIISYHIEHDDRNNSIYQNPIESQEYLNKKWDYNAFDKVPQYNELIRCDNANL